MSELTDALRAIFEREGLQRVLDTFWKVRAINPKAFGAIEGAAVEQVAHGYLSLIREYLEGQKHEVRDYWVETVWPGAIDEGDTLEEITRNSLLFSVIFAISVVSALPSELREQGTVWAATFHSGIQRDMTHACLGRMRELGFGRESGER